jgi:hypothetical protein
MKKFIATKTNSGPFYYAGRKTIACLMMIFCSVTIATAQQDPYAKFKEVARTQPELNRVLTAKVISKANPVWKANAAPAKSFRPFEFIYKNGRVIPPDEMVTLKDGTRIKASLFFAQLNDLERKLNAEGRSLRDKRSEEISQTITPAASLDGRMNLAPVPVSPFKTPDEIRIIMTPVKKTGDITLKPVSEYTPDEARKLNTVSFSLVNNELAAKNLDRPIRMAALPASPAPLRTINETSVREWSFGSASSVKAGIKGELIRYAKIYHFDPQHPGQSQSEFKVTAKGRAYGAMLGHTMDFLNGSAEFYAPADVSKRMTAKITLTSSGITIYNLNESYAQSKTLSGTKAKTFNLAFSASIPIFGPFTFRGRVGVKGTIGLEYSGNLYRSFASLNAQFAAELSGYAEAAICAGGVVCIGAGSNLTLIRGELDMNAYAGIWVQNAEQIVAAVSYYFGFNLEMLKGKIYVYAEACIPDWVPFIGGECTRYSHTIFNWSGFRQSGTLAQGSRTYVIANL